MYVLLQLVALYATADAVPNYTVHVRELTAPEQVVRMPLTNSETVLDAVASLKRSPDNLSRMDLWVVRPNEGGKVQVLRIEWTAIAMRGVTATNYQMLPGDRLFLQARPNKKDTRII